ncbi:hypothetical protein Loa_02784 [Legionella oakridgensis ATCC 33761 = DSM 21215]|uniref:Uncharacterized protein n=1 Tax=Legionella oakridgensis ATCC 33761 = DSM 21215 TaxID=1268635 RepID=W0BIT0_9GAMM|nr:hypothetical protein [Legionella oakridgensis]AHE68314.1 hypothetical protein Loa_02784 [Legionella oakridgensis ATCC 33761 = DSM 21215]
MGQSAAELSGPAATMMKMAASLQETFGDVQDASMSVVKSGMGALAQKAADAYQAYKAGKDDGKEETPANLSPPANPEEPPAGLSQSSTARMDALSAESQQPSGPDVSSSDLTDAASMAPR